MKKGGAVKIKSGAVKLGFISFTICSFWMACSSTPSGHYDVIIKNTKIVDGTGKPAFMGDVAIQGEKIVAVGTVKGDAAMVIDGTGLVTCPGFIDTQSHADDRILQYPLAENYIMQGVTMILSGGCGHMSAPTKDISFGQWMSKVEETGISLNLAMLVGLTSNIRSMVMVKDFKRAATKEEVEKMKAYVEDAMKNGAFGISTGLSPGLREYASDEEIIECAKVAQKYGGICSSHTRWQEHDWYRDDPLDMGYGTNYAPPGEAIAGRYHGLAECLELSRKANNIPQLIGHCNPGYLIPEPHPEYLDAAVARATIDEIIEPDRNAGHIVFLNVIAASGYQNAGPGPGSQSAIIDAFQLGRFVKDYERRIGGLKIHATPDWLKQMTEEEFVEQLKTKEFREKVKKVIYSGKFKFKYVHPLADPYWMDCFRVLTHKNPAYVGRTIGDIARERSPDNIKKAVYEESINAVFDILVEDPKATWADILDKREMSAAQSEFLKYETGMPCIDSGTVPADLANTTRVPPPKQYGTFPHYIDTFVKKYKSLTLEEAIKKATSVPAQELMGLTDRGVLAPEAYADIVVFNFDTIRLAGDYLKPNVPPDGIEYVFVNGKLAYKDKKHTGVRSGKLIRHTNKAM
jgi:N-acyl-D-aspartate/D-glutamate deacylase